MPTIVPQFNKPLSPWLLEISSLKLSSKKWLDWTITCGAVDLGTYLTLQWWARQGKRLPGGASAGDQLGCPWRISLGFFCWFWEVLYFFLRLLTLFLGQLGLMTWFFLLPKLSFVSMVFEVMLQFVVVKLCFFCWIHAMRFGNCTRSKYNLITILTWTLIWHLSAVYNVSTLQPPKHSICLCLHLFFMWRPGQVMLYDVSCFTIRYAKE